QAFLPSRSTLKQLMDVFRGIIVLPIGRELLVFYVDHLKKIGLDILAYTYTRPLLSVELLNVLRASLFIEKHIDRNGAVLAHCYGELRGGGQVTAGYRVYEALTHVRNRVWGSMENWYQHSYLRTTMC
ncbi:MAG: phosphatase, partial [Desulfurococcaceae archaeon]